MLMWETLYEQEPFEGELRSAVEYVVKEDARPMIRTVNQTTENRVSNTSELADE